MSWFWLALIGHAANGAAFIVDKVLLRKAFRRSATYAGLVGIMSGLLLVAIPFVREWPTGAAWTASVVSGALFIVALWAFFSALSRAEATRIVPIVGSLIPILTLVGTFTFLGERLMDRTFVGFGLLILATILLTTGGRGKPSHDAVWLAITSAFLFAISSVTAKFAYDATGFLGTFTVTRLTAALTGLVLLTFLDRTAGREALSIFLPAQTKRVAHGGPGLSAAALAVVGQAAGAVGFVFVQWATAIGSAPIVNAMQAIQYVLLVLAAFVIQHKAPDLLGENLTRRTVMLKSAALLIAGIGMYLIV